MVPDRPGHQPCELPPGKRRTPEGERNYREAAGGVVMRSWLIALFLATAAVQNPAQGLAQPIYSQNQIPAHGAAVEYTVTINNPIAHLYDVEMAIKGIREQT